MHAQGKDKIISVLGGVGFILCRLLMIEPIVPDFWPCYFPVSLKNLCLRLCSSTKYIL